MKNAWDKRDDESEKQYLYFHEYLTLGPDRTLLNVARLHVPDAGRSSALLRHIENLSSRFAWVSRTGKYDQYMAERERAEVEKAMLKADRELGEKLAKLQAPALLWLEELVADPDFEATIQKGKRRQLTALKPDLALKVIDTMVKLRRLVNDQSTENIKTDVEVTLVDEARSKLTDLLDNVAGRLKDDEDEEEAE